MVRGNLVNKRALFKKAHFVSVDQTSSDSIQFNSILLFPLYKIFTLYI